MIMSETDTPILKVEGLKKYFLVRRGVFQRVGDYIRAVDGVDLDIQPNRTLGLVGESGCGKSTVARLILRLLTPDEGCIYFDNQEIAGLNERQFKPLRKKIQMIFQDPYSSLNPRMTVAQSIAEGVRISGITDNEAQQRRIAELLEMVGMPTASAGRYPHEFSGGQRQRVGIARALSVSPRLILCDEPISALDVSIQAQIINLLKDLQTELGLSYLFISHDLNVVSYICDRVKVMFRGKIVESAPTELLFDDPRHPYTLKLLAAVPDTASGAWRPQTNAEGEVKNTAAACGFAGQCSAYVPECDSGIDEMIEVDPGHFVRCRQAIEKRTR
jgi:oligopeptide/dipeptide ABC transporter ATP-binding protein